KGRKMTAVQLLERFLFPPHQHYQYAHTLSGGERRRLYLLTILMKNPNVLILDEPTNDLDVLTLNVLEEFLEDFPGVVIIVTHDRYFLDKTVDHIFILEGNGKVKDFNGKYQEYRELNPANQAQKDTGKQAVKAATPPPASTLTYEERKELSRLEKEIQKLTDKKNAISEQFNDINNLSPDKIKQLSTNLSEIDTTIEDKEMRWLELADKA
ncbi:MAG: hypothetical protein RI894_453, partial [Bacteroidota bacterium]